MGSLIICSVVYAPTSSVKKMIELIHLTLLTLTRHLYLPLPESTLSTLSSSPYYYPVTITNLLTHSLQCSPYTIPESNLIGPHPEPHNAGDHPVRQPKRASNWSVLSPPSYLFLITKTPEPIKACDCVDAFCDGFFGVLLACCERIRLLAHVRC